VFHSYWHWI